MIECGAELFEGGKKFGLVADKNFAPERSGA